MKIWAYASFLIIGTILVFIPNIDLYVSSLFYTKNQGFYLCRESELFFLYKSVNVLAIVLSVAVIGSLIYIQMVKKQLVVLTTRSVLYVLLVFGIGSGIIVNAFLKENVGRARPSQIVEFGGHKTFSKPFEVTDQCKTNGSFTCGHCSFAFGFIAFYFLFRKRWILFGAAAYGVVVSATRIMQGGHFLSDAFFSFLVMMATADLLYRFWFAKLQPPAGSHE